MLIHAFLCMQFTFVFTAKCGFDIIVEALLDWHENFTSVVEALRNWADERAKLRRSRADQELARRAALKLAQRERARSQKSNRLTR